MEIRGESIKKGASKREQSEHQKGSKREQREHQKGGGGGHTKGVRRGVEGGYLTMTL
jgi:hypothetical protein